MSKESENNVVPFDENETSSETDNDVEELNNQEIEADEETTSEVAETNNQETDDGVDTTSEVAETNNQETDDGVDTTSEVEDEDEKGVDFSVIHSKAKKKKLKDLEEGEDEDEDEEEEESNKKKFFILFCMLLLFLIATGIGGFFLFGQQENTPRSIIQTENSNETTAPTTSAPTTSATTTSAPTTSAPTASEETIAPTPSPTFEPPSENLSIRNCVEIINDETLHIDPGIPFKTNYTYDGKEFCGDTYVGFPNNPDRNPWTAKLGQKDCETFNYDEGTAKCESVGARRCTADELQFRVAQGTGCFGDNEFLYSSSNCEENGIIGKFQIDLDIKEGSLEPFFRCITDLSTLSLVRCCADYYERP